MTTLTTKETREIQWAEIKAAAERGALKVGDEIRFDLKGGRSVGLTVAAAEDGRACLIFTDCVGSRPMYEKLPRERVSWKGSDLRRWANEEFIKELPDDLVSIIVPRTIIQTLGGEAFETQDALWAPSITEIGGRREWVAGDDRNEKQFPLFKDERARVKMLDGETWWYWTRSPNTSNATNFAIVYTSGTFSNISASISYGVCLGLYV